MHIYKGDTQGKMSNSLRWTKIPAYIPSSPKDKVKCGEVTRKN